MSINEVNKLVMDELDKVLSEDWVKDNIQKAVRECVSKAIKNIADNHRLQMLLEQILVEKIQTQL